MNIAQEMLIPFNNDPDLLKKVITGGESWVYLYGYDFKMKAQSSQLKRSGEQKPKKAHQVRLNVKVLFTDFFDCNGVVHHELLLQGRMFNKE